MADIFLKITVYCWFFLEEDRESTGDSSASISETAYL